MMAAPKKVDYERLEPSWRAGLQSPHQMAAAYTADTGVTISHAAIINHFKKLGIPRDLSAKIKAKAEAMVISAIDDKVTGKVTFVTNKRDSEIINDQAIGVATIRLSQRSDILRCRKLSIAMLAELEAETSDLQSFRELGELLRSEDKNGQDKRNDLYQKVISSAGRISSMKTLSDTLKTLITLEREAYSISTDPSEAREQAPSGLGHFYGGDD